MGQYFKAYSPARNSIADITYPSNGNLSHEVKVDLMPEEEIDALFDEVERLMNGEFGEYVMVGDYGTVVYRLDDGDIEIDEDDQLRQRVWGE